MKTYELSKVLDTTGLALPHTRALAQFVGIPAITDVNSQIDESVAIMLLVLGYLLKCAMPEMEVYAVLKAIWPYVVGYVNTPQNPNFALMLMDDTYVSMPGWEQLYNYKTLEWVPIPNGGDFDPVLAYVISLSGVVNRVLKTP